MNLILMIHQHLVNLEQACINCVKIRFELMDSTDNLTHKKLAKEIIKQLHEYNDQHTFVGWDMILRKFVIKKFK